MMTAKQLKVSILELAFSGELVEQHGDEILQINKLQKIVAENTNKKITQIVKGDDGLYYSVNKKKKICVQDELLFDIPSTWIWTSLKNVAVVKYGYPFNSAMFNETNTGTPLIRIRDVLPGFTKTCTTEECEEEYVVNNGDMLVGMDGNFNVNFWSGGRAYLNQRVCVISSIQEMLDQKFLAYYLPIEFERISKNVSYVTVKHLSDKHLNSLFIPLPPLEEQKRIVSKIEELMPYVEQYAEASTKLNTLNTTFPDMMKKSILQEAVQGKLVPQDPNDEPASELLKRIAEEKQKLIKEGEIKKHKELPEITEDEIPFDIPESWEWVRLEILVSILGDGIHGTPEYDEFGDYYFINGNNLSNGEIKIKDNTKRVNHCEYEKYKKNLNDTTVLVSINGTLGNIAFYDNEPVVLGKSACYFNLIDSEFKPYLYWLIKSEYFMKYALASATGTTIKNVSLKAMNSFLVPLPPMEEQKRIVARVNELFPHIESVFSISW